MILHDGPVYGPVRSRRLGVSLGVNLLPRKRKICSFECIYCECGRTGETLADSGAGNASVLPCSEVVPPTFEEVSKALDDRLGAMRAGGEPLDVITFAGNGEPTLHLEFPQIIGRTIELRNTHFPNAKVAVLTNGTRVFDPKVRAALALTDRPCLKIDSLNMDIVRLLDCPNEPSYDVNRVVSVMEANPMPNLVVQTMLCQWLLEGAWVNNYSDEDFDAWLAALRRMRPADVQVYTLARETPYPYMEKCPEDIMQKWGGAWKTA